MSRSRGQRSGEYVIAETDRVEPVEEQQVDQSRRQEQATESELGQKISPQRPENEDLSAIALGWK